MQVQVPELLTHFRCAAATLENKGETTRAIVELKHWDARNHILWLKFNEDVPQSDKPSMLKCINKKENLYVIINGNFEQNSSPLHFISNEQPPLRAFFVTGIMVATNTEQDSNFASLEVINRLDLTKKTVAVPSFRKVI